MDMSIPNTMSIEMYLHCGLCITEHAKPQMLEVGWTQRGLQVWCKRHDCNMLHLDFEGKQLKANTTASKETVYGDLNADEIEE